MKDITTDLEFLYHPVSALVVYKRDGNSGETYVEHFDMDSRGNPINAHPLTVREAKQLAKSLRVDQKQEPFLRPKGILKPNILHIDPKKGRVIWHSPEQQKNLHFVDSLGIPCGMAGIPPMVWVADKGSLSVFALSKKQKPTENSLLYNAPFFNVYATGNVCLGTVDVRIKASTSLEEFIEKWEGYFFDSYFSHLMENHKIIKGNPVSIWKKLVNGNSRFPLNALLPSSVKTLKELIV